MRSAMTGVHVIRAVISLAVICMLGACGDGSSPAGVDETRPSSNGASWTTLGTRMRTSVPGISITENGDAEWTDYDPPVLYPRTVMLATQYIVMPDGTELAAYVTLPADENGQAVAAQLPAVLMLTAYNGAVQARVGGELGQSLGAADPYIVQHGYATVVVDVRGTGQSGGEWTAFGEAEQADYGRVVDWVTAQSWSDGRVALHGVSYIANAAVITAAQNHPGVKAVFAIVPIGDAYRDIVFTGGQVNTTFMPIWFGLIASLGLAQPELLTSPEQGSGAMLDHLSGTIVGFQAPLFLQGLSGDRGIVYDDPTPGSFWQLRSPLENNARITVPTFVVGGLHDIFQRSEPLTYETIKTTAGGAKLLIGPWTHQEGSVGEGLPADGIPVLNRIQLRWFDQYVKGLPVGADTLPNVTQFVAGHGYATSSDWPHPRVRAQEFYLRGDGSLSADAPQAGEASHYVVQQPVNGACSRNLSQWTMGIAGLLPLPCATDANAAEVLDAKYETAPMVEDLYINGPIQANVWISTTATDAVVSVRIDDVDPSGNATQLTNGLQVASMRAVDESRSRYLDGLMIQPWHPYTQAAVQPLDSGTPVRVSVEVFPTSALIARGHRLRIAVGSNNLPQGVPPVPTLLNSLVGLMTIHSDDERPSSVVIPTVPASALN
jgi:uncharacterized protein